MDDDWSLHYERLDRLDSVDVVDAVHALGPSLPENASNLPISRGL